MTVHGVGHHTAKELYGKGFRSAEQMRKSGKFDKEFLYHDDIQLSYVTSPSLLTATLLPAGLTLPRTAESLERTSKASPNSFSCRLTGSNEALISLFAVGTSACMPI